MATLTSTSATRDTPGRVVPGPFDWTPPEAPTKNWPALIIGPIIALLVAFGAASMIQLPYVLLAPGGADPINALLEVPPDKAHPPKGSFLLTTVSLRADVRFYDLIADVFDPDAVVVSRKDIFGDVSDQQYSRAAAQEMSQSKEAAVVVAMRALGYPVPETGTGVLIAAMAINAEVPATGILEPGDVITAIDGVPTKIAQEAIAILQTHKPGDTVLVTATRDGASFQKPVRLGTRSDTACTTAVVTGGAGCMGVQLATKDQDFQLPFEVTIRTENVGGPSAGLAFALALIDELTDGELTGGKNVAVTGTIDYDGTVGDVGGVVQKTAAVRRAGATLFLVPPGEFAEATEHAGKKLKVVQVTTLAEALAALRANGGEPAELPLQPGK